MAAAHSHQGTVQSLNLYYSPRCTEEHCEHV